MSNTTPPPPPPGFPPPLPPEQPATPGKSRTNAIIIGAAVAVIAAIIGTGVVVVNSRDDDSSTETAAAKSSTPAGDTVTAAEEPTPTPSDTGPEVFGLSDGVAYDSGVELSLAKFTRATSSDYAAPENTPYVRFTVKIKNGSSATVDTTSLSVNCSYGEDGQSSESIFDDGLNGAPSTKLLAGRSLSVAWGCELPKGEEVLQVEVTPDYESETAIFTGKVK
jgi:hypothetical protein